VGSSERHEHAAVSNPMERSMKRTGMIARAVAVAGVLGALTSCAGKDTSTGPAAGGSGAAAAAQGVSVGSESVVTVVRGEIKVGPQLSGELRAAREATVRAKLAGSVLEVRVEEGQSVPRGSVLVRIEARPLQDALVSSQSTVRSAEQALQVAEREAERTAALVKGGALADRDLEISRSAVTGAQAQVADARARLALVRQQLDDTVVVAPIGGVVSARPVNTGDVVSPGSPLVTIIDPTSMRLDASVPSDALAALKPGSPVEFGVRGYPGQTFQGRIERIAPAADPVTRQVTIYVAIPNTQGQLVAGLFAEGRVTSEVRTALVVPSTAVETGAGNPWVLRVKDGRAERVPVELGGRDDRLERVEIRSGVAEGDVLLVGAAHGVTPGTPITIAAPVAAKPAR
jgi:RND family efflux transporter MFP subunit